MYYNQRLKQDELMHYGVLGMKWGQRRAARKAAKAAKLRSKKLNSSEIMYKMHKSNAKTYLDNAKYYKKMSDKKYAEDFDDKDYLKMLGGAQKAKDMEIKEYERRYRNSIEYSKQWLNIHEAIKKAPVDSLTTKKDYDELINEYLKR